MKESWGGSCSARGGAKKRGNQTEKAGLGSEDPGRKVDRCQEERAKGAGRIAL